MFNYTSFSFAFSLFAAWNLLQTWFQPWLWSGITWEALKHWWLGPSPRDFNLIDLGCSLGFFKAPQVTLMWGQGWELLYRSLLDLFSVSLEAFPPIPHAHLTHRECKRWWMDDTATAALHRIHKSQSRENEDIQYSRAKPKHIKPLWEQRGQALLVIALGVLYSGEH